MTKEERQKKLADMKAFRKGEAHALEFACTTMAWVMVEEMGMEAETVQTALDKLEGFCVDLVKKNLNLRDMQEALRDEHGITVKFGRKQNDNHDSNG